MVETSVKKATKPFVFEPNDANTWLKVKTMVGNFLSQQWRQGALSGATQDESYFVKVGLGETMTQNDIQSDKLIIEMGVAVVRPAEFIILQISHDME
jgi:phage tail sheath protein FI